MRQWQAQIEDRGISHHLGLFDDEEGAARAYNRAAIELLGARAVLNVFNEGASAASAAAAEAGEEARDEGFALSALFAAARSRVSPEPESSFDPSGASS